MDADAGEPSLAGRVAVVAGGAGAVGEGVVRALLTAGARVVVPSRQRERLDALAERSGRPRGLVGLVGDVGDETDAARLRADVEAVVGAPDLVVASIGGWRSGPPLTETALHVWREVVEANLLPHVVAAATFLPALAGRPGARYTIVVGSTAEEPAPGAAPVSVAASAVLALARSAAVEVPEVAVDALLLGVVRTRDRPGAGSDWVSSDDVGRVVVELAAGRRVPPPDGVVRLLDRSAL